MSHRSMSREAIAARYERVRQILLKEPDLPRRTIEERTGCNEKVIAKVRKELAAERVVDGTVAPQRATRLRTLEQQVATLGDRVARLEGPPGGMVGVDGEELRRVRLAAGWTMARAAELAGCAESTWCRWENRQQGCRGDAAMRVYQAFVARGAEPPALR